MTILDFIASERELYQRCITTVSKKHELTTMELSVLLFLANNPGYDTAKDLVEKRHLTKSHVSIAVRALEERGFLKREYRNGNRRTEHLILLAPSKKAVVDGQKAQADFFSIMTKDFSESEMNTLKEFILRINNNVVDALADR